MSISLSGVGPSPAYASGASQQRQDFQSLGKALKSGNLADAQQAFAQLTKDLSGQSAAPSSIPGQLNDPKSPLGQDLTAIGQALQNGDLSGAQQSFAKLKDDVRSQLQSQGQTHAAHAHRGGHHADADNDGDSSATPASDATSGTTINVTG